MKLFGLSLLLASLMAMSHGLTCKKCSQTVMKLEGFPIPIPSAAGQEATCEDKTCATGQDVCTSGYAEMTFKGPFTLTGEKNPPEVEIGITSNWFKNCGKSAEADCSQLKSLSALSTLGGDKAKISIGKCEIKTCTADKCNDLEVKDINPSPIKEMSCYTCQKKTVDGKANTDKEDPDQPECSEKHKKTCPLGTDLCISGNMESEQNGKNKEVMEYVKDCGTQNMASCKSFEAMIEKFGAMDPDLKDRKLTKCNIETCKGDLCNKKTAKEVAALSSAKAVAVNCFLASIVAYFLF